MHWRKQTQNERDSRMNRVVYPAVVLAAGLAAAQVLFFLLVYASNVRLHAAMSALDAAGYLIVPNAYVLDFLNAFFPAFAGALFFTFTIGAGLSLAAMAGAWLYVRAFKSSRRFIFLLSALWIVAIAAVNKDGFFAPGSLSFILIPPFVFFLCIRWMPAEPRPMGRLALAVQVASVLLVALFWLPKADDSVFIDIRDRLLLSNPAGAAVNDFYYRYTLYPAKLIKPPAQKLMVPACTGGIDAPDLRGRVKNALMAHDWLPVSENRVCAVHVSTEEGRLLLSGPGGALLETTPASFLEAPGRALDSFSRLSDAAGVFRKATYVSLFAALPLSLFILLHGVIIPALFPVRQVFYRHMLASALCLLIGAAAAAVMYTGSDETPETHAEIRAALASGEWRKQRDALRAIIDRRMDPMRYGIDGRTAFGGSAALRYWYAASLGWSRHPAAYDQLLEMADDPHPNVACMAYASLGRLGDPRAIGEIRDRIGEIGHWYVQWYAYQSMRRLGWTQEQFVTDRAPSR